MLSFGPEVDNGNSALLLLMESEIFNWRESLIGALLVCVSLLPVDDCVLWAESAAAPAPTDRSKESVTLLGEGAKVRMELTDGSRIKGVIGQVNDEGFVLAAQGTRPARSITYDQIARLKSARRSHKASGQPDALRRVEP